MHGMDDSAGEPCAQTIAARAWFLGEHIDPKHLERGEILALSPLTVRAGDRGHAVIFRFGAVVFIDTGADEQAAFIEKLRPLVSGAVAEPETESADIEIDRDRGDRVDASGRLILREASVARHQVVADVLAKSAVLTLSLIHI